MVPMIELDEDRDVWYVAEWLYGDYVPPARPVLRFPAELRELMSVNLLAA